MNKKTKKKKKSDQTKNKNLKKTMAKKYGKKK